MTHHGQSLEATIEIGALQTGKTRMHSGYYCRVTCGDIDICGEAGGMYRAVAAAVCKLNEIDLHLNIYAMKPDFYESGHSSDSGWGYVEGINKPILLIDEIGTLRESVSQSTSRIRSK